MTSEPPELTDVERARWATIRATLNAVSDGIRDQTLDIDGLAASLAKIGHIDIDLGRIRNSLHVPDDAGQYAEHLTAMLLRIPDDWGRYISCDAGWYPLITELDGDLSAIDPSYVIHQVKEKLGTLSYYARTGADGPAADRFRALIDAAEFRSSATCERCGGPGRLCATKRPRWVKTLCSACATAISTTGGPVYRPVGDP